MTATIYKYKTARGGFEYLVDGARRPTDPLTEYYLGHQENHAGQAWGPAAERYGVTGCVSKEQFANINAGRSLDGKTQLVQTQNGIHVPGFDCVFDVPKSVTNELVFTTEDRRRLIEEAQDEAVRVGLQVLNDFAEPCRPSSGVPRGTVKARGDLMAFLFTHFTARPTPGKVLPDPQLHTHAWIPNMGWCEGKWRAVDQKLLIHKIRMARAAYEMTLTSALERMGYLIEYFDMDRKGTTGWELAGSEKVLRDFFSSRSKQLDKKTREFERIYGRPPTYDECHAMTREDRMAKNEECHEPSFDAWKQSVAEAGLTPPEHHMAVTDTPKASLPERKAQALEKLLGTQGITRNDACLYRWELDAVIWNSAFGFMTHEETLAWREELLAGQELQHVRTDSKDPDYDLLTTARNLEQEHESVATAICMGYEQGPAPTERAIGDAVRQFSDSSGFELDDEQYAAVKHLCGPQRWAHLVGWAGTGKSTVCRTVIDAYKRERLIDKVVVGAVTGTTAQRIAESLNVEHWSTVEGLGNMKLDERTLVILDEAVMCDTPRLAEFTKHARNSIVRALGDRMQTEAIGAGGGFAAIDDALGHAELTRVWRQHDPELVGALGSLRTGDAGVALERLEELDDSGLHESESYEESVGDLVQTWADLRKQYGPEEIIVNTDAPNVEIDRLNRLIQDQRLKLGELRGGCVTIEATQDKRTESFYRGDLIQFTEAYEDTESCGLHMTCGACKGSGKYKRRNGEKSECYQCDGEGYQLQASRVRNGVPALVTRIAPWGMVVKTAKGRTVNVYAKGPVGNAGNKQPPISGAAQFSAPTQSVRLFYASGAVRTQGHEAEACCVLPWLPLTDRGSGYSMATRPKGELHVFTHDRKKLAEKWAIFNPKRTAESMLEEDEAEFDFEPTAPLRDAYIGRADYVRTRKGPSLSRGLVR